MEKVKLEVDVKHVAALQLILEAFDRVKLNPDQDIFNSLSINVNYAVDAMLDFEDDKTVEGKDVVLCLATAGASLLRAFSYVYNDKRSGVSKNDFIRKYKNNKIRPFCTKDEYEKINQEALEMWEKYISE